MSIKQCALHDDPTADRRQGPNSDPTPTIQSDRSPALEGIVVLDLSRVLAGPHAAMLLGDLGARVIKVERPDGGDDTRRWGPPFVGPDGQAESTYFLSANRNKESITLDLKDPQSRPTLLRLIKAADILIENFRPGVMDRLGLGQTVLHELNPGLVVLSISGFGPDGPESDRPGYDHILQAEGGLMSLTGDQTSGMFKVGVPIADLLAGLHGVIGVLAALHERGNSGLGQTVFTSLLAGQVSAHTFQGARYLIAGEVPTPAGNDHPTVYPYGLFPTCDEALIIAVGNDQIWNRFAPLVDIDPDDERFRTNQARRAARAHLDAAIGSAMQQRPAAFWLDLFARNGVPAGAVKDLAAVYATPQVRSQGLVVDVVHPALGVVSLPGNPLRFTRSRDREHLPPPLLGQHSEALHSEFSRDEPPR